MFSSKSVIRVTLILISLMKKPTRRPGASLESYPWECCSLGNIWWPITDQRKDIVHLPLLPSESINCRKGHGTNFLSVPGGRQQQETCPTDPWWIILVQGLTCVIWITLGCRRTNILEVCSVLGSLPYRVPRVCFSNCQREITLIGTSQTEQCFVIGLWCLSRIGQKEHNVW